MSKSRGVDRLQGRLWLAIAFVAVCLAGPSLANVEDTNAIFSEAVRLDLSGESAAPRAFLLYLKAAEAGLPVAQFNVGVMLDSGRGVAQDLGQAAVWYARAGLHGEHRAAYNLGQLYEKGQGVPRNIDAARAWFTQSDLPAARVRLTESTDPDVRRGPFSAPVLLSPAAGAQSIATAGGVDLVWTSAQQPEPVYFFVELRALNASGSQEVFSGFTDMTSIFAPLPNPQGDYAWRVSAVARRASRYVPGDWSRFSLVSN